MTVADPTSTKWFTEAKLGLFLTWDLGGILGEDDQGDQWGQTPCSEFKLLLNRFTAEQFVTDEFVAKIKGWGFRYIVPCTRHGDICIWDTAESGLKSTNSPAKRDIFRELSDACRKHDIKLCAYYCGSDWSHPSAEELYTREAPSRQNNIDIWYEENHPEADKKVGAYAETIYKQIREICANYGELGTLWWDAGQKKSPVHDPSDLRDLVYELQPGILQNTRMYYHDPSDLSVWGDFHTPEQNVPPIPLTLNGRTIPWETCLTTTNNWMYEKSDIHIKSARLLIRTFVEALSKGGNLLLNLSPDGKGRFPSEVMDNLDAMGAWLKANAESVWGTMGGPRHDIPKVALTQNGNVLYVHYYGSDDTLTLPGFGAKPIGASYLVTGVDVPVTMSGEEIVLSLKDSPRDPYDTVIRLEFDCEPVKTDTAPRFPADMVAKSSKTAAAPTEDEWKNANWITLTCETGIGIFNKQSTPDELTCRFAARNDDQTLYIRADVRQPNVFQKIKHAKSAVDSFAESQGAKANEDIVKRPSIEFFFDALPPAPEVPADGRCFQIVADSDGKFIVAFADEGAVDCSVETRTTEDGYQVTCAIPFTSMIKDYGWETLEYDLFNYFGLARKGYPMSTNIAQVRPGDEIGFNVAVNAPFSTGGLRAFVQRLWWHTRTHSSFNDPHQWGRLRLDK